MSRSLRKHRLQSDRFYRYVYPTAAQPGLVSFYGEDRSYCLGKVFDTADIIVEFSFKDHVGTVVSHHDHCYRGALLKENVTITAIYYVDSPYDMSLDTLQSNLVQMLSDVGDIKTFVISNFIDCKRLVLKL